MKSLAELEGDWNETKGKLNQNFSIITDNDLLIRKEKEDEMLRRLQVRVR